MVYTILFIAGVVVVWCIKLIIDKKRTKKKKPPKKFGKLPKQPKDTSKDSCDAAKKTLQDMHRRR